MSSKRGDAQQVQPAGGFQRRRWLIVLLLFLVLVANSIDKAVLGFAAKPMMEELGISIGQYGLLASSFYSLFAIGGLLVAFLIAPHTRPRYILAALLLVWSVVQLPIVIAAAFPILITCRVILGMAEGAGTPTALTCCHEWFADRERNIPSAVVMFGTTAGPLAAAPLLSYLIAGYGWRAAFLVCSLLGLTILALWQLLGADGPFAARRSAEPSPDTQASPGQRAIWSDSTVLGLCLTGFTAYWITSFVITWLAPFVSLGLGYSLVETGWIVASIHAAHAVLLFGLTFVSQMMLRSGRSSRAARAMVMTACLLMACMAFALAAFVLDNAVRLTALAIATGLAGPIYPLSASMISEIAPPADRNRMVTTIFAVITVAGVLSPTLTGWAVARETASGWEQALLLQAMVAAVGGVVAFAMLHPGRTIERFEKRLAGAHTA